jgi:hypothetical protein
LGFGLGRGGTTGCGGGTGITFGLGGGGGTKWERSRVIRFSFLAGFVKKIFSVLTQKSSRTSRCRSRESKNPLMVLIVSFRSLACIALFYLYIEIIFETGTFIELPFSVIKLRDIFTQEWGFQSHKTGPKSLLQKKICS